MNCAETEGSGYVVFKNHILDREENKSSCTRSCGCYKIIHKDHQEKKNANLYGICPEEVELKKLALHEKVLAKRGRG